MPVVYTTVVWESAEDIPAGSVRTGRLASSLPLAGMLVVLLSTLVYSVGRRPLRLPVQTFHLIVNGSFAADLACDAVAVLLILRGLEYKRRLLGRTRRDQRQSILVQRQKGSLVAVKSQSLSGSHQLG